MTATGKAETRRRRRVSVLGSPVDCLTRAEFVAEFERSIEERRICRMAPVNAAICVAGLRDPAFQKMLWHFELANADGKWIELGARWFLRLPVPEHAGTPLLVDQFLKVASAKGYRVFFFGAAEDVVSEAVARARERWPGLLVAGHHNGYVSPAEMDDVVSRIRDSRADVLLLGLPSPMKEQWTLRNSGDLGVPLIILAGGLFDVIAGRVRAAPPFVTGLGMEWFFRMVQQPRRLGPRYLSTSPQYLFRLALEAWRVRFGTRSRRERAAGAVPGEVVHTTDNRGERES